MPDRGKHLGIAGWLREHWDDYGDDHRLLKKACARTLGLTPKQARDAYSRVIRSSDQPVAEVDRPPICLEGVEADLIPADTIIKKVDVIGRIRDFIHDVLGDKFIKDDRLRRRLGVSQADWREIRQVDEFQDNIFTFFDTDRGNRRVVVWGSNDMVRKAKSTVNMGRYES